MFIKTNSLIFLHGPIFFSKHSNYYMLIRSNTVYIYEGDIKDCDSCMYSSENVIVTHVTVTYVTMTYLLKKMQLRSFDVKMDGSSHIICVKSNPF